QVVINVLQRIGSASVFGDGVIVQVEAAGEGIERDILQNGPKAARAFIDLRLRVGREANHLGVAPALEVEHTVVAPAVFVVADEMPGGIGGEGRLAGSREPEE